MDHSHIAVGLHALEAVRVDVLWTPGREGVELNVRDADSLVSYGIWEAPRLAVVPRTPDADTLHAVARRMLAAVDERPLWADFAFSLALKSRFTWVPEKLAG